MRINAKNLKIYVTERKTNQNGKERKFKTYYTYVPDIDNEGKDLPVTIKFRQDSDKGDFKDNDCKVDAYIDIPGYLIYKTSKDPAYDYAEMRSCVRNKEDYAYIWIHKITRVEEKEEKENVKDDYEKLTDYEF